MDLIKLFEPQPGRSTIKGVSADLCGVVELSAAFVLSVQLLLRAGRAVSLIENRCSSWQDSTSSWCSERTCSG